MPEDESIPTEGLVWEVGKLFVMLRCLAERQWIEIEPGWDDRYPLTALGRTATLLVTKLKLCAAIKPQAKFNAFADAIEAFWSDYCRSWDDGREEKIRRLGTFDPELQWEAELYMYDGSPLQNGQWKPVKLAAARTIQALTSDPELKACLELHILLMSEVFPTFVDGQRSENHSLDTDSFARRVGQHMQILVEHFAFLAGLELAFTDHTSMGAGRSIHEFSQQIGKLLMNPQDRRGYLGLVLDRRNGRVARNGAWKELTGKLGWELLKRLEKSRDSVCPLENLRDAWGTGTHDCPEDKALYRAIADLRKKLAPLGIDIKSVRNIGWMLTEKAPDLQTG
jgi:hypothetical protein